MTTKPNSKVRDRVFRMLFAEKKNALELYNALNGTQYENEEELEITTLDDAIYMSMNNDVSFLINETMNLFEHQSTINPNLPLRGLFYFADLYRRFTADKNQYSTRLIMLPTPVYVVFYNGKTDIGEEKWLKLSDAFQQGNKQSHMELWTQMININHGHNQELMKKCRTLEEYGIFTNKIRTYQKTMEADKAIEQAIEECITEGILEDFLRKRRVSPLLLHGQSHFPSENKEDW